MKKNLLIAVFALSTLGCAVYAYIQKKELEHQREIANELRRYANEKYAEAKMYREFALEQEEATNQHVAPPTALASGN